MDTSQHHTTQPDPRDSRSIAESGSGILIEASGRAFAGHTNPIAGLIEAQEARGQSKLVGSDLLPKDAEAGDWDALKRVGVTVDDATVVDGLFYAVVLPAGWRKRATEHSMWSDLLDAQGRVRAMIFYKAAFYDRAAHMTVSRRYDIQTVPIDPALPLTEYVPDQMCYGAVDHGVVPSVVLERWQYPKGDFVAKNRVYDAGVAWLDAHYPSHRDPAAYWEV